jgi:putative phage-type endonuclease
MELQRTPDWYAARLGKATASRIADIVARTKTGWGASRANYAAQLVAERLTGAPQDRYESAEMRWGTETEPQARSAYEFYRDCDVEQVGFIDHPSIPMSGASPDGLIGPDGLLELKCPNTSTHIDTLLGASIPKRYLLQAQWQMACTGRKWCDVASFDPRMPESMKLWIQRVHFCQEDIGNLEMEVSAFLGEVTQTVEQLRAKYDMLKAAA